MARVVMFDVMGVRWLLTSAVSWTPVSEIDAAEVVVEVDDRHDGVTVHKNRDGAQLIVDSILKRAILRHWHGTVPASPVIEDAIRGMDVGPRYVDTDALTLSAYERQVAELGRVNAKLTAELAEGRAVAKTANDANHKLLVELGKFREQEVELRRAARTGPGETVLHAVTRLEHTATCAERETDRQRERAKRIEDERHAWERRRHAELKAQLDEARSAVGEDATAIGILAPLAAGAWPWFEPWASRVHSLRLAVGDGVGDGVGISYSTEATSEGHRWCAYTGKGQLLDIIRHGADPHTAAKEVERYYRERAQKQIEQRRNELDKLATAIEER